MLHDPSFLEKYPLRETSVSRSNAAAATAAMSYVRQSQSVRRVYGFILIENRRRRRPHDAARRRLPSLPHA